MYMLNMVIILIIMYSNVVTAIDKIPTYLLRFNRKNFLLVFERDDLVRSRQHYGAMHYDLGIPWLSIGRGIYFSTRD